MPEEFDLAIDGENGGFLGDDGESPARRRTPSSSAASSRRKGAAAPRRALPPRRASSLRHRSVEIEEEASSHRARPRIAIDAAISAPRRVNLYRRLSLSFLAATVFVIGVIIFFTFQRAEIKIEQDPIPLVVTFTAQVNDSTSAANASVSGTSTAPNALFSGMVMTVTTSTSRVYAPTQVSDKPGKSHGTITVHNTGPLPQSLIATTRFLSEGGALFRATHTVIVPPKSVLDVDVAADKTGADSDIGPSKFTIPGLNPAQQKIVYGVSANAMVGGSSKVGIVSQQDIDHAQEDVRKALLEIGQQALASVTVPDGDQMLYTTVNIKAESSAKPGDQTGQFRVTASGTMAFVAYPKAAVFATADHEIQNQLPTPYHKVVFISEAPTVSLQSINVEQKTALLQIYREGRAVLDAHSSALQPAQFIGRSRQEIIDQIATIKGVKHVDVSLFPFWLDRSPKVPSRITITLLGQ